MTDLAPPRLAGRLVELTPTGLPSKGVRMNFQMGFWHPFGPHGGESVVEILARKQREINANGWTLWSFQPRLMLTDWMREIRLTRPDTVAVFCSDSRSAKDPPGVPVPCIRYRFVEDSTWLPLPASVSVPHPFRWRTTEASAFVVERILVDPVDPFGPAEWFLKGGGWQHRRLPTRGEYLIRRGQGERLRRCGAVLVLRDPYLAVVSCAPADV